MSAIKGYSHSSLAVFETCPRQFEHKYILKDVKEAETEAAMWGNKVHKELENFAVDGTPVKSEICKYGARIVSSTSGWGHRFAEHKFGLTEQFKPTGFFSDDVMLRGVIDYGAVQGNKALLVDYKTGKRKDDFNQMTIFTVAAFSEFEHVDTVKAAYVWLKFNEVSEQVFTRSMLPDLKEAVVERVDIVRQHVAAGNFPMKPSGLCRGWCPVKSCPAYRQPGGAE